MKKLLCLLAGLALLGNVPALAITEIQTQEVLKSDPGRIDATRLEELKRKEKVKKKKEKKDAVPDFDGLLKKDIKEKKTSPEFTLKKIEFTGNTAVKTDKLQQVVDPYIGEKITVEDLLSITKKVTDVYQEKGYLTSMAYLPPQKITGGVAKIEILEGKVGNILVKGNKWYKTRYLKKNILKSNNLEEDKILNVRTLRGSLQEINQTEHLEGRITIEEGEDPEFTELILEIDDSLPLDFGVSWDNQGRELIGKQRALFTLSNDNLTGYGDRLYGGTALASGTVGANGGYSIPIGTKGTRLNFDYSYSHIKIKGPDPVLRAADINGASNFYSLSIIRPFIKNYDFKLYGHIGFDMRDAETKQKNADLILSKYNTRVLRTGLSAVKDDTRGRWYANTLVSTGVPLLGARTGNFLTGEAHKRVGTNKFVKMETGVTRIQMLPWRSYGIVRVSGQWATRRLLASEQMQLGGIGTVRGFEEGFLLGDWGVVSSAELRTPIPFFKKVLPEKLKFIDDHVKWANFVDFGYVDEIHRAKNTVFTNLLCSVGTGLNINLFKSLNFNVYMGIPLAHRKRGSDNVEYDAQDVRVHFNLTTDIY